MGAIVGWEWDFGDGTGSTVQHPTHTYDEPGAYTVSLTVETGDGEDTEVRAGYVQVGGAGASIGVSPSLIQFGHVPVGQRKIVSVTIRNDGDEILTGTASVEAPFDIDGDAAYAIPPEGETFLNVVYAPTAAVASHEVIGLPGGGNAQVALHGSAIAPEFEQPAGVRLNELVVWNTSGVVSANGEYVDWIELYNENDYALDISGWTLTDDDGDPDKYTLPAGTVIGPKGFLLVYASTETASFPGELHTGFALDEVNGGYVGLFAPIGGTPTLMSEVEYPEAEEANRSYSLLSGENKQLQWWGPGVRTKLSLNWEKATWNFTVFASPAVAEGQLRDPSIKFINYSTEEPSHHIWIEDWLTIVSNYTNTVLLDDSPTTIWSPNGGGNAFSETIEKDCTARARVHFTRYPLVTKLQNLPESIYEFTDLLRTMQSVPDKSLVLIGGECIVTFPGEDSESDVLGTTLLAQTKKIILLTPNKMHPGTRTKWHAQTFVHELGHYAGILGHPLPSDQTLIMNTGVNYETTYDEPWFQVSLQSQPGRNPIGDDVLRRFYEGEFWGTDEERKLWPPFIREFDLDLGADELFLDERLVGVLPW